MGKPLDEGCSSLFRETRWTPRGMGRKKGLISTDRKWGQFIDLHFSHQPHVMDGIGPVYLVISKSLVIW